MSGGVIGATTRGADLLAVEGVMTTENQSNRTDVDKALLGDATYRSLGEQRLSPAEERFEKGRRTIGLFLAVTGLGAG